MIITTALQGFASSKNNADLGAVELIFLWVLRLIFLGLWITAIVLALNCNATKKFWPVVGAFFFPEIYLIQFGVRKYLIKEPGYCPLGASRFG